MAVTEVIPEVVTGPLEGELDERAQRNYTRTYIVITDDPNDGPQQVGDAPGIPRLFSKYLWGNDSDMGSRLKRIRVRRMDGELMKWFVTLQYDSMLDVDASGLRDPLARPPQVRWSSVPYQAIATHDVQGRPILNSANDEFDPPPLKDDSRLQLVISRNEADFQVPIAFSYMDAVNSDAFFGFPPRTAKMTSVESDLIPENDTTYWRTTYTIQFRRIITNPGVNVETPELNVVQEIPPWNITLADVGYYETDIRNQNAPKRRIKDSDQANVVQPFRLDGSGNALRPFNRPRSDGWAITYQVYEEKDFAMLNLP